MSETGGSRRRHPSNPAALALWNFSSQWFLVPQGTGIIAVTLHQSDCQFHGLKTISQIVWVYTIVLLSSFVFLYLLRILLYPRHVANRLRTSIIETSCLASISISFETIIQMIALSIVHDWGPAWGIVTYVLWWTDTAMAVVSCIGIPYVFVKLQPPGIHAVTPSILLPLIAALTSAAGGGIICRYGAISDRLQVPVIVVAYLEMGVGIPLAMSFDTIFLSRLFDKSFPDIEKIYQDMILCGPFGQASFALEILGHAVSRNSFARYNKGEFLTANAATPIAFASQFAGLLSWGYGTFWWCFAIISIVHTVIAQPGGWRKTKFSMSAWALIFPWVSHIHCCGEGRFIVTKKLGSLHQRCSPLGATSRFTSLQSLVDGPADHACCDVDNRAYLDYKGSYHWKGAGS